MNWLYRIANDVDIPSWDSRYPRVGGMVSGLMVMEVVPNIGSISAEFDDWKELSGLREVSMSEFGSAKPYDNFYATNDIRRSRELAEEIRNSRQIAPLIVGIDNEGPYILEGVHRFVALGELGVASFPALVVIDLDNSNIEGMA